MKFASVLASILFCLSGFSQESLLPAYIITNSGDSLKGMVDYVVWSKNPRQITFSGKDGQISKIPMAEVQAIGILGKGNYVRAIATLSTRPIDTIALRNYSQGNPRSDTIFLKRVVTGGSSLFSFHDFKDHFFLQTGSGPITELVYEIESDEYNTKFFENNTFRKQLSKSLVGTSAASPMEDRIPKLQYNEKDLSGFLTIVDSINSGKVEARKYERPVKVRFFAGLGIAYNQMRASGSGDASVTSVDYIGKIRPGVQVGVDFSSTQKLQNLIVRTELGYYKYLQMGDGIVQESPDERPRTTTYQVLLLSIKPSLNLLYKLVSKPGLDIYVGAGYVGNFTAKSRNRMRVDYLDDGSADLWEPYLKVQSFWGQGVAKAGVLIKNKFEIGLNLPFAGSFLQYDDLKVNPGNNSIQLNYRF